MRNFTSNTRTLFVLLLITISFIVLPLVTSAMLQARVINVPAGGNLQAALNEAQPGDTIVLQANADYACSCILPVKSGATHITVKSSRADEISGRVNPATQSTLLARVRSGHPSEPAFATVPGAHHYTLLGLDIAPKSDGQAFHAIRFGDTGTNQDTLDEVPHNLAIDRSWIHGASTQDIQRGITLNSASTQIINSYISEIHYKGVESQAIAGWNGPGPYRIENNYLEGAGINIIFGGAVPSISGLIPSDILITGNTIYKPPSWRGVWTSKNLFELKNARKVRVENNILENSWVDAQIGWAIILNTTGDSGSWNVIEDVTITRNIIRNAANGINIRGLDDPCDVLKMRRIIVADNLLENIGAFDGAGRLFQLIQGSEDVSIIHNTGVGTHSFLTVEKCGSFSHTRLIVQDNLSTFGEYGVFASGGAVGTAALNNNATNWAFQKNAIYGRPGVNTSAYPPDNFFPVDLASASMIIGTDGKRVGVRLDVTPSPTPTPTATPTPVSSPSPSPSPTSTPTPTPSPTPSPTPEPTPSRCSISAPSSVTVPQWTSGQLSVNVSNLTAPIEVIAESGSGQVSAVPYSRTVNGTSAILAYEIRVKRKSSAVTFKSPCGERAVQVVVR